MWDDFKTNFLESWEMLLFRMVVVTGTILNFAKYGNVPFLTSLKENGGQFLGFFIWYHFLWSVLRNFDSKLLFNPQRFEFIEKIPPKWREIQVFRDYLRQKCNKGKPLSYLFDLAVINVLQQFVVFLALRLVPLLPMFAQVTQVNC